MDVELNYLSLSSYRTPVSKLDNKYQVRIFRTQIRYDGSHYFKSLSVCSSIDSPSGLCKLGIRHLTRTVG
ncbi:hypothetical protein AVEN_38787-1, partial [Araneus ventricosus]